MSNLLKEAIVDADALRNAALKNAESTIIDKYSDEVRQTLTQLLEQDELGLEADPLALDAEADPLAAPATDPAASPATGGDAEVTDDALEEDIEDVPYSATDGLSKMNGQNLKKVPAEGENVEVELNLGSLRESVEELQAEIEEELMFNENDLERILAEDAEEEEEGVDAATMSDDSGAGTESAAEEDADADDSSGPKGSTIAENEEIEISDELIDDIVERLTVDMGATLSGWAGRSSESVKWELEKALAHRRSTDIQDELEVMRKAHEELVFENKQLTGRLSQYEQVTLELKETLQNVNLSNARLLYTNRVLRNISLNERQKNRIVESISKADSVTEAKTIYNTLESAVEAKPKRSPQSLSEAINRPSSVIRASRKEAQPTDPFAERMRRLAGIK